MLKILGAGKADDGSLRYKQGLRITYVAQEPFDPRGHGVRGGGTRHWQAIALREQYLSGPQD